MLRLLKPLIILGLSVAVTAAQAQVIEVSAETQQVPFDSPPDRQFTGNVPLALMEPTDGVTSTTGLLVEVGCLCPVSNLHTAMAENNGPYFVDDYNVVYMSARYRYDFPYDFAKYQCIDIFRAIGKTLELYPEIDRRRIYLYGISGGGHIGLNLLAMSTLVGDSQGTYPGLFAGAFLNVGITKITTAADVQEGLYENDPNPNGWTNENEWLRPDLGLSTAELARRAAERQLRSPQHTGAWAPKDPDGQLLFFVAHGTQDEVVDFQHFLDFRLAAGESRDGGLVSFGSQANVQRAGEFLLVEIAGGLHDFTGAAPDEDTFDKVMTKYGVPHGFLATVNPNPVLAQAGMMPELNTHLVSDVNVSGEIAGRRGWRIQGTLNDVTLTETTNTASAAGWTFYP